MPLPLFVLVIAGFYDKMLEGVTYNPYNRNSLFIMSENWRLYPICRRD